MKKLLLLAGVLWSVVASAQFVPGQLLTADALNSQFALYAPLSGATFTGPLISPSITSTSTTLGRLDNSTSLATDAFVNQQGASAVATVPFAGVTGGIYNQATLGTGCQVVVFASGGIITSSLTISNPGSGYAIGDLLAVPAGNSDAVLRVTGVSGGGVTSVGIAYGGSGYITGNQVTAQAVPPGRRAVVLTGTLTSNLTFIIQNGTFLTASREVEFINNTTGAFTITVKLSNGAGGSTGTGVVLPQGTGSSASGTLYTDGQNDVWLANSPLGIGALTPATAASTYAPIASPTFTGIPAAPTASATTNTTQLATTAMVNSAITGSNLAGAFTTLAASSAITPSQTAGIVGTTTNNNANAGSVGEYLSATTASTSLTTATPTNCASEPLTAGDYDVESIITYTPGASETISGLVTGVNTTSATFAALGSFVQANFTVTAANPQTYASPVYRVSLASSGTLYAVGQASFTGSTMTCAGFIRARRVR